MDRDSDHKKLSVEGEINDLITEKLQEAGWKVEGVAWAAAVEDPDDDRFLYTANSYTHQDKMDPAVRRRLFRSLVATAEVIGLKDGEPV